VVNRVLAEYRYDEIVGALAAVPIGTVGLALLISAVAYLALVFPGHRFPPDFPVLILAKTEGSPLFMADLVRAIPSEITTDFIGLASYGGAARSSGQVRILSDLSMPVEGRHVLIVEDIVDTGLTISYLRRNLEARHPKSVKVCVLVDKIVAHFGDDLSGRRFALWGLAFKPNTDDMREAPSRVIIDALLELGATISAYDPVAIDEAKRVLGDVRAAVEDWPAMTDRALALADELLAATASLRA